MNSWRPNYGTRTVTDRDGTKRELHTLTPPGQVEGLVGSGEPPERTVLEGKLQRLSVSQVKVHMLCPRKWAFKSVFGLKEPETKAQAEGIKGHKQVEHYLGTGQNVLGPIALAGLKYLPEPGADLGIEIDLGWPSPLHALGVPFFGAMDLVNGRRVSSDGVLRLTDHKFTSEIGKWAATGKQLADARTEPGLQMVGYAVGAIRSGQFPELSAIELEHIYYQTRGQRYAEPRLGVITPTEALRQWHEIVEPRVQLMSQHAAATKPRDVPPSIGPACKKFGGCPFATQCQQAEKPSMSLADRLKQRAANQTAPAAPQSPAPAAPSPAPAQAPIAAPAPSQAAPAGTTEVAPGVFQFPNGSTVTHTPRTGYVLAGKATQGATYLLPSGVVAAFLCNTERGASFMIKPGLVEVIDVNAEVQPQDVQPVNPPDAAAPGTAAAKAAAEAAAQPEEKPKAKRGRPRKSEQAEPQVAEPTSEQLDTMTQAPDLAASVNGQQTSPRRGLYAERVILVDCVPQNGSVFALDLLEYASAQADKLAKAMNVEDVRFVPDKQSPLAFGNWKGALLATMRGEPPAPGVYLALGVAHSELLQIAIEALAPSFLVVRRAG